MKVLFLANNDHGLYGFRKELISKLLLSHEVYFSVPNGQYVPKLEELGCHYIETDIERHGTNPFNDLKLYKNYKRILKDIKPDIVFTYTVKPNIYGGMACAKLRIPYVVNVTGLGTGLENKGLLQKIILILYKKSLKKAKCVFFQNKNNLDFMLEKKAAFNYNSKLLPGSGVNLEENTFEKYPEESSVLTFITIGRVTKDKGIDELIGAIKILKQNYSNLKFVLVGRIDGDYEKVIDDAVSNNEIEYLGHRNDVHELIKNSHATIHPSYHEGTSNVLLETAACGRPIIATDVPGCINTFDDGVSGISFKPRDIDSLVSAVEKFLKLDFNQRKEMGVHGRQKMELEFDRNIVIEAYLREMKNIGEFNY